MKTAIYFYTGTGNSLWTACLLAEEYDEVEVYPMIKVIKEGVTPEADVVGLVFPVHMWGVPNLVIEFLKKMDKDPSRYYFALAVNAGQVSRTLIQLQEIMASHGLTLSAGYDIVMPSNYIPWGGPGPLEQRQRLYDATGRKIKQIAPSISKKEPGPIEKGPLWQRIIFTWLYRWTFKMIPNMDKDFWVDDRCNSCGTCAMVCVVKNIIMEEGRPAWQHHCEQCLACIQWCPMEAIQYGKKTPAYERYHHPWVKIKGMIGAGE